MFFCCCFFQKRKNVLNDAKDDVKNLAKKLKKAKNKLKRCKDTLDDVGGGVSMLLT